MLMPVRQSRLRLCLSSDHAPYMAGIFRTHETSAHRLQEQELFLFLLAGRTNGRSSATVLRPSVVVPNVVYFG